MVDGHGRTVAPSTGAAADGEVHAHAVAVEAGADVVDRVAAATAHALGKQADALLAGRGDVAGLRDGHRACMPRRATRTTDGDVGLESPHLAATTGRGDHVHAGVAAAATDALGRQAVGLVAEGAKQGGRAGASGYGHRARVAATRAGATDPEGDGTARGRHHARDVQATHATTAADALHEHAVGARAVVDVVGVLRVAGRDRGRATTVRRDCAIADEAGRAGIRSRAAAAAHPGAHPEALAEREAAGHVERPAAAAAGDAMHQHADAVGTFHGHGPALRCRDGSAGIAGTAEAAEPEHEGRRAAAAERVDATADVDAAVAATTTHALHQQPA